MRDIADIRHDLHAALNDVVAIRTQLKAWAGDMRLLESSDASSASGLETFTGCLDKALGLATLYAVEYEAAVFHAGQTMLDMRKADTGERGEA